MLAWPTIPDFTDDPKTHTDALRAVKQILEMITGQRDGSVAPYARLFINSIDPQKLNVAGGLQLGDVWIDTNNSNKLRFWDVNSKSWGLTA